MKRILISLLVATLAFETGLSVAQVELPDMGASTRQVLPPHEAEKIGSQAYRQIRHQARVLDDPLVNEYVSGLGHRLASYTAEPGRDYKFFVVAEESVNAFAIPGGYIGLHSGLITTAEEESELAGVVAHEIAHVTQNHIARIVEDMQKVSLPVMLGMLGVILASGGNADVAQAALIGGQAALIQRQINFTRSHEAEADRIGIRTLAEAGYDPEGMAQFFSRMDRVNLAYGKGPSEFLRTHPVTSNRIAEAKSRARSMPEAEPEAASEAHFLLIRERVRALAAENADNALEYYRNTLPVTGDEAQLRALKYGQAVALIRRERGEQAAEILSALIESDGPRLPYRLSLAEARMVQGRMEDALQLFARLQETHGSRDAVKVAYADALMRAGEPARAERLLRDVMFSHPRDAVVHRQYAKAADAAGRTTDARIAIAEAYFLEGNVHDALQQLRQGQDDPRLSARDRSRLQARYDEMWGNLSEDERERLEDDFPVRG